MSPLRWMCLLGFVPALHAGEVKHATPADYRRILPTLAAGDTLSLAAGVYDRGLPLTDCEGSPQAWITIEGPESGVAEIRQTQVANCVELRNCQFVALKRLAILGGGPGGIPGLFGISAQGGLKNRVHHILVEDCLISDWNTSQQAVGISTKTPTWDWTIRRNHIRNCGTGLYLGNSNGADPFIRGIIEHNLVENPLGYCMEIKFQKERPAIGNMPGDGGRTLIRHNVFIKDDRPSPDGDRPNVLVGGFPASGPGSGDCYEIHGNVFWNNPREALLQASGRVSIHDNLFIADQGSPRAAIALRDHDLPLKRAHIYHNTLFTKGEGIRVAAKEVDDLVVVGNAVFSGGEGLITGGTNGRIDGNLIAREADATTYLVDPASGNFLPRPGRMEQSLVELSIFSSDTAATLDFDGREKGSGQHRGAFTDANAEGRWRIQRGLKPVAAP